MTLDAFDIEKKQSEELVRYNLEHFFIYSSKCGLNKDKMDFSRHSATCCFTTENIDSYFRELDINGKNVLTVTASGDQLINLAMYGARRVDCFDSNVNSFYFTKLKLAALQVLSYQEFLDFFSKSETTYENGEDIFPLNENDLYFDYELYKKIRPSLDKFTLLFFDTLYEKYNHNSEKVRRCKMFYHSSKDYAKFCNTYLQNEEAYLFARKSVVNLLKRGVNFYELDVFDLTKIDKKYDLILLSNIFQYLNEKQECFINYVEDDLSKKLNPLGTIMVNYQYCYRERLEQEDKFINNLAVYVGALTNIKYKSNIVQIGSLSSQKLTLIGVPTVFSFFRKVDMAEDCVYLYRSRKI